MKRLLARHRRNRMVRALVRLASGVVEGAENLDYDATSNGEERLLRVLGQHLEAREVFDVGANVGEWARMARAAFPEARLHCFEILPGTFQQLSEALGRDPAARLNAVGLSDAAEEVTLKVFSQESQLTTMTEFPHELPHERVQASTRTGDDYLAENDIEHVDLLKIDTEGAEPRVLEGFRETLEERRVSVVQFEYGRVNILTHHLLRDFHEFFDRLGYRVGKVFPTHVEFRDYDLSHEDFIGPNFLAVDAARSDLVRALS